MGNSGANNFRWVAGLAAVWLLAAWPARADSCRWNLADQSSSDASLGFYFDLEDYSATGESCRLTNVSLGLALADGTNWHYLANTPAWQIGRDYTATAIISNGSAEVFLDGRSLGKLSGQAAAFAPYPKGDLFAASFPFWAAGAADYLVTQTGLTVTSSGGKTLALDFPGTARPPALRLLSLGLFESAPWSTPANETWTITATFHLDAYPDPRTLDPFVDRYGQSLQATWAGKIQTDQDLLDATTQEAARLDDWGLPAGYDPYGGLLGTDRKETGTGYFRLSQHNGMWWLMTPDGNPCFFIGVDGGPDLGRTSTPITGRASMFQELPPTNGMWADAWTTDAWNEGLGTRYVSFDAVNMIRKYGANWRQVESDLTVRRLKTWGFSGLGKFPDVDLHVPSLPMVGPWGVPTIGRHPDVFDDAIKAQFRNVLAGQITPRKDDPFVLGWSLLNEYDNIVSSADISAILAMPQSVAGKRALIDEALASIYSGDIARMAAAWHVTATTAADLYSSTPAPPASDREHVRQYFARTYYEFAYRTVKELDPNHLFFGFWIGIGLWENEEDWRMMAQFTDVVGYDRYSDEFLYPGLDRLIRESGKPVMAGEFGYPATYHGMRGFRIGSTLPPDDATSGVRYANWLREAWSNPLCVGVAWFEYRDQPVTGRGSGQGPAVVYGESIALGLVDVGDRPKWDLVERVRDANLAAASARLNLQPASRFVPLSPCRVADTRDPGGPFGGPAITGGSTRSFAIPQSACGVPAAAQAYSLNVTVVPRGRLGYLSLWPTGEAQPFVSTLNSWSGTVVANAAIVPAGSGGAVRVFASDATDVILDIDGYFDSAASANSYSFYPAQPCRVADTRDAAGMFGGPSIAGGQSRDFPVPSAPCGMPSTASAYAMNVTVVPSRPLGFLTAWPAGQVRPSISTLNSWTGRVVANAAIVGAGTNGSISVFVTDPTAVILDANGYFAPPGDAGALSFYAVAPCRLADTRNPDGPFGGPILEASTVRSFTVPAAGCSIPSTAAAYSLNLTVVPEGPLGYLTAWPTGALRPVVSTLNSWDGSVVANAAILPASADGSISVFVTNRTHVILDINGYFAPE